MKSIILFLLFIIFLSCKRQDFKADKTIFTTKDSGYIYKKDIQILNLNLKDSILNTIKQTDTIGKLYKKENHYIICMTDFSDEQLTYFLIETTPNGKILKKESYGGICWNKFEVFQKKKDFFMFEDYGLGSAFNAREQYFFKEIIPQKKK